MSRILGPAVLVMCTCLWHSSPVIAQGTLYTAEWGSIGRVSLEDGHWEKLVGNGLIYPQALALDTTNNLLYWSDREGIWKSDIDAFDERELVVPGPRDAVSVAVHPRHNLLYWSTGDTIARLDMSTGQIDNLRTWDRWVAATVTLDPENDFMYWTEWPTVLEGRINRSDLDGNETELLVEQIGRPVCLTLDLKGGKMYWGGNTNFKRANVDGSEIETFHVPINFSSQVTDIQIAPSKVDSVLVFFTFEYGQIYRTSLAGEFQSPDAQVPSTEIIIDDDFWVLGIAIDHRVGVIYWTNPLHPHIKRAAITGADVEVLLKGELILPHSLAVDHDRGKLYWMDGGWGRTNETPVIQRSDLDGSNKEDLRLFTYTTDACGLVLDGRGGKMYWKEGKLVRSSNLDGSGLETVTTYDTRIACPLALDEQDGKLYWASASTPDSLFETDLASGRTRALFQLLDEFGLISDLEVSPESSALYWRPFGAFEKLRRTSLTDLRTDSISIPFSEAPLDAISLTAEGDILWINSYPGAVWRTKHDGTQPELLMTKGFRDVILVEPVASRVGEEIGPDNDVSIEVYPIPASTALTVSMKTAESHEVEVDLYDMLGRRVKSLLFGTLAANRAETIRVDLTGLTSGVYYLRVASGHQDSYSKLVINR